MGDEFDLLRLFTAACLISGRNGYDAVAEAELACEIINKHIEEQRDLFGDDDGSR